MQRPRGPALLVFGTFYYPRLDGSLVAEEPMEKAYDDGEVRWVLAQQMIMRLGGLTPVDLDDEYARYLSTSAALDRRASNTACRQRPRAGCPVTPPATP
ncbi:hypothetical protein DKG71_00265 [Streptomyces sp. NEAU-S7GS2]|nr:hypothetical protein DKG71_00265 [Streptomyces sp. NEAU-S7GS2]